MKSKEEKYTDLVLGPFQGPIACTRIQLGRGVCGTAWAEDRTVVVPLGSHGQVVAVLDIDSRELGAFDKIDALWLGKIADCVYGPYGAYVS